MGVRPVRFTIPLSLRVFLAAAGMLLVVLGVAFVLLARWSQRTSEEAVRRGLEQSADLVAQFLAGRQRSLGGGARVFVQGPYFRAIVAERRRDDILDQSFEAAAQLGADWVFMVDERGTLLAKSDEPGASGSALGEVPLVRGALRGQVMSGFGVSRDSLLFHAIAVPIAVPGGAPIGALVATRIVDSLLARDVKAVSASDVVFFVRDANGTPHVAASTLSRTVGSRLMTVMENRPAPSGLAAQSPSVTSQADVGGVRYAFQGGRLTTAGGEAVGGFLVLRRADDVDGSTAAVRRALLVALLVGLVFAAAAAMATTRGVAAPLAVLAESVRSMRDDEPIGSEALSAEAGVDVADPYYIEEIRELGSAVQGLSGELRDRRALAALWPGPSSVSYGAEVIRTVTPSLRSTGRTVGTSRRGSAAPEPIEHAVGAIAAGQLIEPGTELTRRYVIDAVVGQGRSATVYRAIDRARRDVCAVKVLAAPLFDLNAAAFDELSAVLSRFKAIAHRNVVGLRDAGAAERRLFLAFEYVEGETLAAILRARGALAEQAVRSIATQLTRAMHAAHGAGVVHGALSPSQLLVRRDGVMKVSDYGATAAAAVAFAAGSPAPAPRPPRIAGATIGEPEYMAPERLLGATPDELSDIYSAGVVLSECLVGTTPFHRESPLAFLAHKLDTVPTARGASSRPSLHQIIAAMGDPERERRPASAGEVLELLGGLTV